MSQKRKKEESLSGDSRIKALLGETNFANVPERPAPPRAIRLQEEAIEEAIREAFQPHGFD